MTAALVVPSPGNVEPANDHAIAPARPPKCKLSGKIEPGRKLMLRIDQDPGALLRVFGDRTDKAKEGEPHGPAGPFASQIIEQLTSIALGAFPDDTEGELPAASINGMLQAMSAFEPTNELEGMIAAQCVALHHVTMDSISCAKRTSRIDIRQQHLGAANKSARSFATLLEALNRHRGKTTTQRVIVENVTVEAGGQAVVGAVQGVGSRQNGGVQAHGYPGRNQGEAHGAAGQSVGVAALPGAQSGGQTVSASSVEGEITLPHARGSTRKRRAAGQQKPARARPQDRRRNSKPKVDCSNAHLSCPVALIARQVHALAQAMEAAEVQEAAARNGDGDNSQWEAAGAYIWDRHHSLREVATTERAASADGAVFQLMLILGALDELQGAVECTTDLLDYKAMDHAGRRYYDRLGVLREQAERKITQCLYSVRAWIERNHSIDPAVFAAVEGGMRADLDPAALTDRASEAAPEVAAREAETRTTSAACCARVQAK